MSIGTISTGPGRLIVVFIALLRIKGDTECVTSDMSMSGDDDDDDYDTHGEIRRNGGEEKGEESAE